LLAGNSFRTSALLRFTARFQVTLKRGAHITLFFTFVNPYFHSDFTFLAKHSFKSEEKNSLLGEGANYRDATQALQAFLNFISRIYFALLNPQTKAL